MAAQKLTVVISQAQGKNPARRGLEEELAAALIMQSDVNVSLVPHLYDLSHDHSGMLFLQGVPGPLLVLSWLYPRAARWTLDRAGVKGWAGRTLLVGDEEEDAEEEERAAEAQAESNGSNGSNGAAAAMRNRPIYCIDLRASEDPREFLDEIQRIAAEQSVETVGLMDWIQGSPRQDQLERYLHPERMLAASGSTAVPVSPPQNGNGQANGDGAATADAAAILPEPAKRRWYPVIDYERCTNCMECIDFCLFGVYGVDRMDQILVEQQDNCKKGCPACSRVCPENAIIFPGHKSPAIAGAAGEVAGLKIDLSRLFGGGEVDLLATAVAERDAELLRDGREAVGASVGMPKRQEAASDRQRDELDDLMDGLDDLDL